MKSHSPKSLSISKLLFRHSPKLLVFAAVIGAIAGALYSLIIPFLLGELGRQAGTTPATALPSWLQGHGAAMFFLVCVLILSTKALSIILVNNIAKSATAQLRLDIAAGISAMPADGVENIGLARLLNVLVDDVNSVSQAAVAIPMIVVSTVTVMGMLGYLATLNVTIFLAVLASIAFGVTLFQVPMSMAGKLYQRARALRDVIQEGARGLVTGVYELKLSPPKARRYLQEELVAPQRESVRLEKLGDAMMHLAGTASDLLSFFIIGVIVYILPRYVNVPPLEAYGVVMAMLYIAAPVAGILAMMRLLKIGQVAVSRIHALGGQAEEVADAVPAPSLANWSVYGVRDASYTYQRPAGSTEPSFGLAPATLEFKRGQINFIVGGNGSGKSTLSKLLSLHYKPAAGQVYFDGLGIDASNLAQARTRISVIFSNYYLFSKLYRPVSSADQQRVDGWLDALGLRGKTELVDGAFTTTRLSDGQRRRLALLVALLEDRDIYIFDEWAADQDPAFKRVFYEDILQQMKRENKLVLVITHDDRYFDCADRLIFMESGAVTAVREQGNDPASYPLRA